MSTAYEYRKVYADCVTPEGEVCVLYLHYVRIAGVWTARASVERYHADGQRELVHGTGSPALVGPDSALADVPLDLDVGGQRFRMVLEPELGPWQPAVPPPPDALTWRVLAVRTRAHVQWGEFELRGTGYVDYVQITRPTRQLGLHHLRWGRVHLPDRTVVLEHLDLRDGRTWDVGVDWRLGESTPRDLTGPATVDGHGRGTVPLDDGAVELVPERVLHDGNAFDPERVPRRIDRWACEVLGGPTHETRWLGEGHLGKAHRMALYEAVTFG